MRQQLRRRHLVRKVMTMKIKVKPVRKRTRKVKMIMPQKLEMIIKKTMLDET